MLNKNIIKDAIADAREIEKYAIEQAKKSLEEALMPQLEKVIEESLFGEESDSDSFEDSNEKKSYDTITESIETNEPELISENNKPNNTQDMLKEENLSEDEIFEISNLFEEEESESSEEDKSIEDRLKSIEDMVSALYSADKGVEPEGAAKVIDDEEAPAEPAAAPAAAAAEAPAPAEAPAEAPAQAPAEAPEEETVAEEIMFELDEIDEEIEGEFEEGWNMEEMDELEITNEDEDTTFEEGDSVYEISLEEDLEEEELELDPETGLPLPPPEWGGVRGGIFAEDNQDIEEAVYEVELEEDENLEEKVYGGSFTTINRAGNRKRQEYLPNHQPMNESKKIKNIKAQYESKVDELIKENESLKSVIKTYKSSLKEFEGSFVELKSQLNEMQIFNGKLAYANKLLTKGGLTNDEKIRIAEEFDKCPTVEDAKKLYNKIISENKFSSKEKINEKLKSVKPAAANAQTLTESKSETLFESEERKRMRMLAGIVKTNE